MPEGHRVKQALLVFLVCLEELDLLVPLVLSVQTDLSVSQESKVLLEYEERMEPLDNKEKGDLQDLKALLEIRETLERTVLQDLMDPQDLLV